MTGVQTCALPICTEPGTGTGGTGTEPPTTPPTQPPYVAPPIYVPPITPPTPPTKPGYGPISPTEWGKVGTVNLPGLNPGWITNVPAQYQTTSPVQSKYYWGQKPYQPGPTFNRQLYTQVPAPAQPWGLQQMYIPMDIQRYVMEQALRNQQAIAPAPAPGPVKPA